MRQKVIAITLISHLLWGQSAWASDAKALHQSSLFLGGMLHGTGWKPKANAAPIALEKASFKTFASPPAAPRNDGQSGRRPVSLAQRLAAESAAGGAAGGLAGSALAGAVILAVALGGRSPEIGLLAVPLFLGGLLGGALGGATGSLVHGTLREKLGAAPSAGASAGVGAVVTGLAAVILTAATSRYNTATHYLRMGIGGAILGAIGGLVGAGTVELIRHLRNQ